MDFPSLQNIDLIILLLILISYFNGWRTGLFQTLIAPLSLLACSIIGVLYYDFTDNIVKALFTAVVGTVAVTIFLKLLLFWGRSATVDKESRRYIFWASRLSGGVINILWNGIVTMSFLVTVTLLPPVLGITDIQDTIIRSTSYTLYNLHVMPRISLLNDTFATIKVLREPEHQGYIHALPETKDFLNDPKIIELGYWAEDLPSDGKKKMIAILKNPEFLAVLGDEALMHKWSRLMERIYKDTVQKPESP